MDPKRQKKMPIQVVARKYNECDPENIYEIHYNIPGSEYTYFEENSHMLFEEE